MICKNVRKYLYAFADGQFDVKVNCDVLDHLKMCPACTRVVGEHQALRKALRRIGESTPVPNGLGASVRAKLAVGRRVSAKPKWRGLAAAGALAAACVGFAVYSAWEVFFPPRVSPGVTLQGAGLAVMRVTDVHNECCQKEGAHQSPDLPSDLNGLREAYASQYSQELKALVPDLSEPGFALESANFCGVRRGRQGAHVIYKNSATLNRLSFFSVPRLRCLKGCGEGDWFEHKVEQEDKSYLYVLAWCDDEKTTHICCSSIDYERMKEWMSEARLALNQPEARAMFAALWTRE
ncbi:MAG: hypothetical protein O7D94_03360 [Planctomycetota bacterium]|nr:hypothetical protein [Planctomycetota bacterium]